jgi:integrase/recombinase XerC/integrase/recombinase XerD
LDTISRNLPPEEDYVNLFIQSRAALGASSKTLRFYRQRLSHFIFRVDYFKAARQSIEQYLNSIPPNHNGLATRHASFRALKTFYRWLNTEYGLLNPMKTMPAPILGKPILPSLTKEQVMLLIDHVTDMRNKAIIALLTESGLRLSEMANVQPEHIDWTLSIVKVLGKGRKEAYAPFGELSRLYLTKWLAQYHPYGNIWGMNEHGISTMLKRLKTTTGLPCNPHTFRRTFACLLRKQGLDCLTIKDLGRWESLEMVQRYTRSVTFQDSMRFYKGVLT